MENTSTLNHVQDKHNKLVLALIGLFLLLQLHLQFVQEVNWDEFFYLSRIYEYQRGELERAMQNFHVHFFGWLPLLQGTEIAQIKSARLMMWLLEISTLAAAYLMARVFFTRQAAAFTVLAFITSTFVLVHGTSFRTDPIGCALSMWALAILLRSSLSPKWLLLLSVFLSLAFLITIKVIFFAPAFIGALIWRFASTDKKAALFIKLLTAFIGMLVITTSLFLFQVKATATADMSVTTSGLSSAFQTTILSPEIFPRRSTIIAGLKQSAIQSLILLAGVILAIAATIKSPKKMSASWLVIFFAMPLISLVFYRNAFPYFIPFIFAPAFVAIAYTVDKLAVSKFVLTALAFVMSGIAGIQYYDRLSATQITQDQTIRVAHTLFPANTNYIDKCGMLGSLRKRGFFMSSWGMKNYQQKNENVISDLIANETIPLVINNGPALSHALTGEPQPKSLQFTPVDQFALKDNYLHYWGPIWVAGKSFERNQRGTFIVRIPGPYTIKSQSSVSINGQSYEPGSQIVLDRKAHTFESSISEGFELIWGENIPWPQFPEPTQPIFQGF